MVTAVDLVRGLGVLTGMDVVEVDGRDRLVRHELRGQARRRPRMRWPTASTCSSSTSRPPTRRATPAISRRRSGPSRTGIAASCAGLVEGLDAIGPWRLLLLPDHATPVRLKTHTSDPVPYLLVDSAIDGPGGAYTEPATAAQPTASRAISSWAG